ncbi:MAG: CotH kinase family protein [Planctomycetes bacterium]|nr:CotH kinase family protein [Planctomycetota bacterium]
MPGALVVLFFVVGLLAAIEPFSGLLRQSYYLLCARLAYHDVTPRTARAATPINGASLPASTKGAQAHAPVHFDLNIAPRYYQKLCCKRDDALDRHTLVTRPDDFVPATLRYRDRTHRVEVRLKGDFVDHLRGDKWSLRVKVKGDDAILGMRRFSLQDPARRGFMGEWLLHKVCRREGLVALRYQFVTLTLNGEEYGVFALEEHFDKLLIEHNQRREGPILKFDEDLIFEWNYAGVAWNEDASALTVDAFTLNRVYQSPTLIAQYRLGRTLLEGYRTGRLTASRVLDSEQYARFLALADLLSSGHAVAMHNVRFYYNPVTSLLEPIPFDSESRGFHIAELVFDNIGTPVYPYLRLDLPLQAAYLRELERLSAPGYVETLLDTVQDDLAACERIMRIDLPRYAFSTEYVCANRDYIARRLRPEAPLTATALDNEAVLRLANVYTLPIELQGVEQPGREPTVRNPVILPPLRERELTYVDIPLGAAWPNASGADPQLDLTYRILGTQRTLSDRIVVAPTAYAFFVAGHTYGVPDALDGRLHPPFTRLFPELAANSRLRFGILTGDVVEDPTPANWDRAQADLATLGVPVHIAAGNHDMYSTVFEERYPTFEHFVYKNDLFLVLHSQVRAEEQARLVESLLSQRRYRNIFVLFHHLLWLHENSPYQLTRQLGTPYAKVNLWTLIEPLLQKQTESDVYVFAGDLGVSSSLPPAFYDHYGNITLIASGMGGHPQEHFLLITVDEKEAPRIEMIALDVNQPPMRITDYLADRYSPAQ